MQRIRYRNLDEIKPASSPRSDVEPSSTIKRCIEMVTPHRNIGAHESSMTEVEASKLREKWLAFGTSSGGIFGAVCPRS